MQRIEDFPFEIQISFHKVIEQYEKELEHIENEISREYIQQVIKYVADYPELKEGFTDPNLIEKFKPQIRILLDDLFPTILTNNEIKAAAVPFHNIIFNSSKRFKQILKDAGKEYKLSMRNLDDDIAYLFACIQILKKQGFNVDISRPFYYDIPDENGVTRHYRLALNADFVEIIRKDSAPEITQDDVDHLVENIDDLELWKEKFPPDSYIFKGFTIVNLTDVTIDDAISELKTTLLFEEVNEKEEVARLQEIFRSIYKISDLRVGITSFNRRDMVFERLNNNEEISSYILDQELVNECDTGICESGLQKLIEQNDYFTISNVDDYLKKTQQSLREESQKT